MNFDFVNKLLDPIFTFRYLIFIKLFNSDNLLLGAEVILLSRWALLRPMTASFHLQFIVVFVIIVLKFLAFILILVILSFLTAANGTVNFAEISARILLVRAKI